MTTLAQAPRYHVTRFDPGDIAVPHGYDGHHKGYGRASHIDRSIGAVHTGFGTCELAAGGTLEPHVHSYEEFLYVTQGNPVLTIDGESVTLAPDDCAFVGVGATHSLHNGGAVAARWIDLQSPQARPPSDPADTFWVGGEAPTEAPPLDIRDPRSRSYFRWNKGQHDLDALKSPVSPSAPAVSSSMSSALLAYGGISVKMLIDERHGAHLGNLFMVDYAPEVVLHPHDHTIEEAFYMLEGSVVYVADGEEHILEEGDVAYAGVGCIHAFRNPSRGPCRWLETRAPLPPLHHSYRFNRDWDYLAERLAG
jgi:mannose-6-phosphate isomerase-like protein (cupin superfamily)